MKMKKYKVEWTFYDGSLWRHSYGSDIVEAENPYKAQEQVESRSCPWGDYSVDRVTEVK